MEYLFVSTGQSPQQAVALMEDLFVQTTYWLVSGLKHHLVQWKEFLDK
jgi:hypothetical protein